MYCYECNTNMHYVRLVCNCGKTRFEVITHTLGIAFDAYMDNPHTVNYNSFIEFLKRWRLEQSNG